MKINTKAFELALANASMNRRDLAKKSGVAESTMSRTICGKGDTMPKTIGKLAVALGVSPADIIESEAG